MGIETILGAGASLLGGAMSSSAAGDAAQLQSDAANRQTDLQRDIFNRQVGLQDPFRRAGLASQNRLLTLLGINPSRVPRAQGIGGGSSSMDRNAIRAQLLPQYTRASAGAPTYGQGEEAGLQIGSSGQSTVDEAGLNAAIDRQLAQQQQSGAGGDGLEVDPNDPAFGSLMRDFSMADYQADPGYQFRMDEGAKALERSAAGRGGLFSGRAGKDMARFSQGLASQEYGNAFDRFQVNRANKLNPLQSLAGVGQTSSNALGSALNNYGAGAGEAIAGGANAQAAGRIGSANAINNSIGQGWNMYQGNRMFNALSGGGGGNSLQAGFSNTGLGSSGFGTGLAYGNQDFGQYL